MATLTFTETITFEQKNCHTCGVPYALTEDYVSRRRKDHATFYCPNGHAAYYPQDNEEEKLRKELKRKEQELANIVSEKIIMENILNDEIKEKDKKLKRLTNGVCPCCNRTFANLHNHMKKQHPEQVSKMR